MPDVAESERTGDETSLFGALASDPAPADQRRRDLRALLGMALCLVVAAGCVGAGVAWTRAQVPDVQHTDPVFAGLEEQDRPPTPTGPASDAMNILLVGTDRRSELPTTGRDAPAEAWEPGEQRADTMMLVHVSADRSSVQVVSLPRDTWVTVPGRGGAKLNAAYSWGGLPLTVETVEDLTDVRVDHVAVVDWAGFAALVDVAGGVEVTVPRTVTDSARDVVWTQGDHTLDGAAALDYVGQRYGLPEGDLDRTRRQQAVLRQLVRSMLQAELRSDPQLLSGVVTDALEHVTVDETWSLPRIIGFAWSLRNLRTAQISFLTAPVGGYGYEGPQSVVYLDDTRSDQLWRAIRRDRADTWIADNPELETREVVR